MSSTGKIIAVQPGGALSLQYRHGRDELWVVLEAGAQVESGETVMRPGVGEKVLAPRATAHRLSATGNAPARILEISFCEFEEDIVRLDDVYRRTTTHDL